MIERMQFKGLSSWRILIICFIALVSLPIFDANLMGNSSISASENTPPTATITSPSGSSTYNEGDTITFSGSGSDAEDGTLIGNSLVWTSSINGQIGTGTSFTTSSLSSGSHTITFTATDSAGATGSDSVSITIASAPWTTSYIEGKVTEAHTGDPIKDAQIETNGEVLAFSLENGTYLMIHPAGTWTVTASAAGYESVIRSGVVVLEGESVTQDFELTPLAANLPGWIGGTVTAGASSGMPIEGEKIESDGGGSAVSLSDGSYLMTHPAGTWTVTASATGYEPKTHTGVVVPEGGSVTQDFELIDVPPTISSTTPTNNSTDVYVNRAITATFSEAMDSSTITTTTFLVNDGSSNISGIVTYSGKTATFTPSTNLDYNTTYTATITNGAKDLAGNALESDYTWSFTTGTALDIESPIVISTTPADNATDLATNVAITATFSEAMDSSTITTATFLVNDSTTNIAGTVTYSVTTATFTLTTDLEYITTYTATITTGVEDLAGNALESDYTWSFTTGSEQNDDDNDGQCFIATAADGSPMVDLSPLPIVGMGWLIIKLGFVFMFVLIILFITGLMGLVRFKRKSE